MRRIVLILVGLVGFAALAATTAAGDGNDSGGDYLVRAYFDNAGFLVHGEEVRIAGARVGSVDSVDVALPGEAVTRNGSDMPGKAVAVLKIEDPGFQAFLTDASCLIRPQSLLGEKYVECEPTQSRAPGSQAPPELSKIPDGEIGAGQYMLPLENNGKQVDLDLVNNITRQPEADRLRLILNDLGAGLSARGKDLAEVIKRADPALQETDKVLAILAKQNRGLAQLASDSDQILAPLARERTHVAGFIRNAADAGQAAAERQSDISLGFQRFPPALKQLQSTMVQLRKFALQAKPVANNLSAAAPGLAGATKALGPFSRAGVPALRSLGAAAAQSGPNLAASDSVIRDLRTLGVTGASPAKNLQKLFGSLRKTKGIDYLMSFILNSSNVFNGFDDYGHYLRAQLQITNCVGYVTVVKTGCAANFGSTTTAAPSPPASPQSYGAPLDPQGSFGVSPSKRSDAGASDASTKGTKDLLQFLVGDGR